MDLAEWSAAYDRLQINAARGRWAQSFGKAGGSYLTPYGRRFVDNAIATEIKTGYQSLTQFNRLQILKDSYLARTVRGYDPVWKFFDQMPSAQLLDRLRTFDIPFQLPTR